MSPGIAMLVANSYRSNNLDEKTIRQVTKLIKRGLPLDGVCDYLGIWYQTFWEWINKGAAFINGDGEPKHHAIYGAFFVAIKRATAKYRYKLVNSLHTNGNREIWARELAILERRDRKNFGRNDPLGGDQSSIDPDEKFV